MEVRRVGFKELEDACCQLSAQGCLGTLYQSYEWQRTWWNHFGANHCQPCILVASEGPRIIGLAPLMIEKMRIKGFPVLRTLRFIGTGPSDYLDFLVVQGREAEIMSAFFNHLIIHKREWDLMWLSEVPDNSPARNFLVAGLSDLGLTSIVEQHNVCPYIELNNTYAEYVGSLNFETRKKVKKLRNRLVRTGEVEFVVVDNDPGTIRETMREFFCLHNERWRREGARGHVRSKELIDFHTEAAVALSNKLHLCVLRLRGQIIASMYCYDSGKCALLLLGRMESGFC